MLRLGMLSLYLGMGMLHLGLVLLYFGMIMLHLGLVLLHLRIVVLQGGDSLMLRADSDWQGSRPASAEHHHAVAQPPSVIMNSDMEAFGNRLSAIVNADFYAAALAVGPVDVPLGEPLPSFETAKQAFVV